MASETVLLVVITVLSFLLLATLVTSTYISRKRQTRVSTLASQRCDLMESRVKVDHEVKRLQKSLVAAQQVVERNMRTGGAALIAYKLRLTDITVGEPLGEGSFGTVYHGTFQGSECAIKRVRATLVTDRMVRAFLNELTIMSPLRHPNLVNLIGGCWTDGPQNLCIVMEYCSNGTLCDIMNDFTWEDRLYSILKGVVQSFVYLHHDQNSLPLIHRDLKPANVLISYGWMAKVADFGESIRYGGDVDATMSMVRIVGLRPPSIKLDTAFKLEIVYETSLDY